MQYPLRLAYCMTYNKGQGQTLEKVLLDITHAPFAHGHLYVAISRITYYDNIRLFYNSADDSAIFDNAPAVKNIAYRNILQHVTA